LKRPLDTGRQQETPREQDAQHTQHKKQQQQRQQQHEQQPQHPPQKKKKQQSQPAAANGATELGSPLFSLRRVAGASDLPQVFAIRSGDTLLTIGRAVSCDFTLKVPHVSKSHAKLNLQETGNVCMLMLQDTSSNGTWLNGQKLLAQRFVQLEAGDLIAFLPPTLEFEQPTYEVSRGAVAPHDGSTTTAAFSGSNHGDASILKLKEEEGSPSAPMKEARRNTGDKPQQPGGHSRDIGRWLQSLAGKDLCQYEDILLATYDDLKQIRDLYADNVEDFFEDIGVESQQHCSLFRGGLASLQHVVFA